MGLFVLARGADPCYSKGWVTWSDSCPSIQWTLTVRTIRLLPLCRGVQPASPPCNVGIFESSLSFWSSSLFTATRIDDDTAKLLDRIDFLILSHLAWQELSRGVASIVAVTMWFALILLVVLNQRMFLILMFVRWGLAIFPESIYDFMVELQLPCSRISSPHPASEIKSSIHIR